MDSAEKVTLTIFLLKRGLDAPECIEPTLLPTLTSLPVILKRKQIGTLYIRQTPEHPPQWASFFSGAIDAEPELIVSSSVSAVYVTQAAKRTFVITFGYGRHLIAPGSWEARFGLKATLNSVDPDLIRAVDASTLEANPFFEKKQAAKALPLGEFGLDLDQDILKAITGRPTDPELGTQMTGSDALSVRVSANLSNLSRRLEQYLDKSNAPDYRERFPWVDHVATVRDPREIEELDHLLLEAILEFAEDKVWAAIPEAIDWTEVDGFRFLSPRSDKIYDDVTMDQILGTVAGKALSIDNFRKWRIYTAGQGQSLPTKSWSYYDCLIAEVPFKNHVCMLNGGTWHRVDNNFAKEVKAEIDRNTDVHA